MLKILLLLLESYTELCATTKHVVSIKMVFVRTWDDFQAAAEGMYTRSPDTSRFTMKYSHNKGELVLKLTDNVKVRTNGNGPRQLCFNANLLAVRPV